MADIMTNVFLIGAGGVLIGFEIAGKRQRRWIVFLVLFMAFNAIVIVGRIDCV